jgi:hypothetical protein
MMSGSSIPDTWTLVSDTLDASRDCPDFPSADPVDGAITGEGAALVVADLENVEIEPKMPEVCEWEMKDKKSSFDVKGTMPWVLPPVGFGTGLDPLGRKV